MACCKKHKRQRFIKQVKSFCNSLYLNIKSGFKHVTHEDYNDRISICRACPFLNYKDDICQECGCYIKIKARLKVEDCPQNYWKKID